MATHSPIKFTGKDTTKLLWRDIPLGLYENLRNDKSVLILSMCHHPTLYPHLVLSFLNVGVDLIGKMTPKATNGMNTS